MIIVLISVVGCFYIFESYLTYKIYNQSVLNKKKELYKKNTGKKYDTRSRLEIFEDLKKVKNEITVMVPPNSYLYKGYKTFPLSGISNKETINCNENGYFSTFDSDRYGFNNPKTEWDSKEIEFMLVGDSFAQGACVNKPYDMASILRNLSNKSILNLSYGANGPLLEYATLREYLNPKVKKVLWIYYEGNDLEDLADELKDKTLIKYLDDLNFFQDLLSKQNKINDLANIIIEKEKEKKTFVFKFMKFIKLYNLRASTSPTSEPKLQPEFKKILEFTKELTIENKSKLYFIYLPVYYRYNSNYDNTNYLAVKNVVNELGIPFIDIHTEVFEKENNPLKLFPFGLVGHYNKDGYKKVGDSIYRLTRDKIK